MKRIASFEIDHDLLTEGLYTSRRDGDVVTYDLRFIRPNTPPFLPNATMHTIEHLFATYVRNSALSDRVIYFGPMGWATGFYLLIRDADHAETLEAVKQVLGQIIDHNGPVFGNSEIECGNYKTLDLASAVSEAKVYLAVLQAAGEVDFCYPTK